MSPAPVSIVCKKILSALDAIRGRPLFERRRDGHEDRDDCRALHEIERGRGVVPIMETGGPCRPSLLLVAAREAPPEADWSNDLLQELYIHIQAEQFRRLKMFHGTTVRQLKCFLRPMARNMAIDLLEKWQRIEHREMAAARQVPWEGHGGPTISAVQKAIKELNSILAPEERCRLTAVAPARFSGGSISRREAPASFCQNS